MSDAATLKSTVTLVPRREIEIADFIKGEDQLKFTNPRHFQPGRPGIDGKGFDHLKMKELRDAIRDLGLLKPICIRKLTIDGKVTYQLIAGERRLRSCIRLAEDNEECFSLADNKKVPGSQLYEHIEAKVYENITDKQAMEIAYLENSTGVDIGDAANLHLFMHWRKLNFTDEDIMNMTKKTSSWIYHMDTLSKLDEQTLNCYCNEEINQTVALQLAKIDDVKQRVKILKKACEFAKERVKDTIGEALKDLNIATKEVAKVEKLVEKDKADPALLEEKLEEAEAKLRVVSDLKKQGIAKRKDYVAATKSVRPPDGTKTVNTALRTPAIAKNYIEAVDKLIKNNGYDDEDFIAPVEILQIVKFVASSISDGEKDFLERFKEKFEFEEE